MREELIKEIWDKFGCKCGCGQMDVRDTLCEEIADFVIKKMEEYRHA